MSEGGAGLLPCCPWSWVTVGAGYPSPIPELPAFSPINTVPGVERMHALLFTTLRSLPPYLSKPGCAARGDSSHVTLSTALWAAVGGTLGCAKSFLTVTNSPRA